MNVLVPPEVWREVRRSQRGLVAAFGLSLVMLGLLLIGATLWVTTR